MLESREFSRVHRVLFDRPILKLFVVLLLIVVAFAVAQHVSLSWLKYFFALVTGIGVAYAVVLTGYIVHLYLVRKALARLLSARDIVSLLLSYVMFIAGILLVISVLFMVVEELHWGYLTHGPTSDRFNSEVIDSGDPNISHDYFYFTTTTFFTVGYGDISPMGGCKILAIITAFAGNIVTVVLMGIVVSVYLNRRARPPDQASGA